MTATARRRPLAERPFALLGLLLLLPAVGFGLLGWTSVQREGAAQAREAALEARDAVERRVEDVAGRLIAIERREDARPYYAYQTEFAPEETVFQQLDFQPSPLTRAPEESAVLGWFQWELGQKGVFPTPEVFGPGAAAWAGDLVAGYGAALSERLAAAPQDLDLAGARRVDHALRVVKANEERGQLIEEILVVRSQTRPGGAEGPSTGAVLTPYLEAFYRRATDAPVPVRYGAFRYLARAHDAPGPPLVAWRLVGIPAAFQDQREVARDRWLLQGYALDPGVLLPSTAESSQAVTLIRADAAPVPRPDGAREASLASRLDAQVLPDGAGVAAASPRLALVAVVDPHVLASAYAGLRARFLWLLAGVVVVVAVGFLVLTRGLRREVALARRKEDFLAAVTHELKTPLTGIRMHADMLREGWVRDPEASQRYAGRILEETDRLGHLVDQVLDLAALERGVARAHAVPGDVAACVRDAVALVQARADAAHVELAVEVSPDLPQIALDPRLVRPLVLNLVDNALKYGVTGTERTVRVRVGKDGAGIALEVSDRGPGLDPRIRRRLFEPFLRAGDELTRTSPGIGIGLALVKRYADAHDAKVTVESDALRGTRVTVRFPPGPPAAA